MKASWYKHVLKPWWARQKALKTRRGGWREHIRLSAVFALIAEDPYVKMSRDKYAATDRENIIVFQEKHKDGKQTYYKYYKYFEGRMVGVEVLPIETIHAFERK